MARGFPGSNPGNGPNYPPWGHIFLEQIDAEYRVVYLYDM
jgi:hypothetical protein